MGYMVNCIISAIEAGGDMINMQQGVSSATILDPATSSQVSIMGRLFLFLDRRYCFLYPCVDLEVRLTLLGTKFDI